MKLIQSNVRFKVYGSHVPHTITLHHTAGGRVGSEGYLKQQGLGYHFMIDKDGTIHQYNGINNVVGHSSKANRGYIGVSYISGGKLGPVNDLQLQASIELCESLAKGYESITKVSDHATIDKIVANRGWKSDPQWPGEKSEKNDWSIKHKYLDMIADGSGLKAIKDKDDL